jgi:hypothetical protein
MIRSCRNAPWKSQSGRYETGHLGRPGPRPTRSIICPLFRLVLIQRMCCVRRWCGENCVSRRPASMRSTIATTPPREQIEQTDLAQVIDEGAHRYHRTRLPLPPWLALPWQGTLRWHTGRGAIYLRVQPINLHALLKLILDNYIDERAVPATLEQQTTIRIKTVCPRSWADRLTC